MGSGHWFKAIISLKSVKKDSYSKKSKPYSSALTKSNSFKWKSDSGKHSARLVNGAAYKLPDSLSIPTEERAAIRIQTAFRAYRARKSVRRLKGIVRLQMLTQKHSTKRQATTTLGYLHSWSKIQSQVKARRLCMVTEGRLKQKKLENQLKLEAKLHDLDVEWCGGSETMEEILARIHNREEAAVKRERAMSYAFNHQWRANSSAIFGSNPYKLGKANWGWGWGWSWMERWIAARPWESRVLLQSISPPKKPLNRQASKNSKASNAPTPRPTAVPVKAPSSNGKVTPKPRRLSFLVSEKEKPAALKLSGGSAEEVNCKKDSATP